MTFAKQYVLTAAADKVSDLKTALLELAAKVRAIPGSSNVDVLQDRDDLAHFVFIEHWDSIEAHQSGGKLLGKEAFAPLMSAIGAPPKAHSLDHLTD
ncbi:antibiotic biosynthesis monooxygenase (plasmid) [Novosphingobium resinovorum]|uniref:putative quinol monooxygenase n=1 Tax=Novosphingobium TaxID=165696 RepID=UPI001B3C61B6|nr:MULTISPECIES: antibiotic biosynthesis monooxygenase [Novosphingobium]MBF7015683.1 antibiotic biosynthesis monooxygenase [Novosphingobium sp. HR1a]WJM29676.1 antibiotic biosynthesis monooxygenase [Novosphingobium resinovorum]